MKIAKLKHGYHRNLVGVIYGMSSMKIAHFVYDQLANMATTKNYLWWPCLLTDQDKMSNLYRGPSIDASYQVSVHLAKRFQRRRFLKIGQSETRIACQVRRSNFLAHLAKGNVSFCHHLASVVR
jgi:hypothetical protein